MLSPSPLRQRLRQQRVNGDSMLICHGRFGMVGAGWDPIWIGWGPIWIGWGQIRMGWGRHQLQPSLPSHSLIYIHCFTPSSFDSSGQLFFSSKFGFIAFIVGSLLLSL